MAFRRSSLAYKAGLARNRWNLAFAGLAAVFSLIAVLPLVLVLGYVLIKGGSLISLQLLTSLPPAPGLDGGGIGNAILGTLLVTVIASLIAIPVGSFELLALAVVVEACTLPVATALLDKLVVLVVDPKERARIMAIMYVIMILFTSPFGWIAGQMSEVNRNLPFVLNIVLYSLGGLLTFVAARVVRETGETVAG